MKNVLKVLLCSAVLTGVQAQATATELVCELGQRMGMYGDQTLDSVIALIWQGQRYNLQRVATSTGANRFEDSVSGLVWIGIPAKGMLLDARHGKPLANECKTDGQVRAAR
jgi:hypothetical protein